MVIKDITVTRSKDRITLAATCKLRKIGWDDIYITLEGKKHHEYIYEDASPFAAALLIPSMKQGEDLVIHGSISEQLYEGMHEVMKVVLDWGIGLKPIEIKVDSITKDKQHGNIHTASTFSGGVDSFYTYLKHKKDRSRSDRIDTFILVKGFDVDLRNTDLWQATLKNVRAIAKKEGIDLLTIETNARVVMDPILPRGDYTHGGCLAAVGLALRNGIRKLYIPSTFSKAEQIPWGSHPNVDPHWSTEQLTFIHDGIESTRLEKITLEVSRSPVALQYLRVCYMNKKSAYNCGRCDKCLRTMVGLYASGVLQRVKTFPHKLDYNLVAEGPHVNGTGTYINYGEVETLKLLKEKHLDSRLQDALAAKIDKSIHMRARIRDKMDLRLAMLVQYGVYLDFAYVNSSAYTLLAKKFGRKF
jgi:hypothetical protein